MNINQLSTTTRLHPTVLHNIQKDRENSHQKRVTIDVLERICTATHYHLNQFLLIEGVQEPPTSIPTIDPSQQHIKIYLNIHHLLAVEGISLARLTSDINETYNNLWNLANHHAKRLSLRVIGKLVAYFNCRISDLFRLEVAEGNVLDNDGLPDGSKSYEIYIHLSAILKKKNLSMLKVSEGSGLPYELIRRLRNDNVRQLDIDSLEQLCNFLQVAPTDLIKYRVNYPLREHGHNDN
ncbi:helix-turn-helix domain-containing protein [Salibacterium aidingense]|uniref:helix-turn-helix domain-containing protein n=1 Tax=Salibacterium aidingense TaxID=384933 RepID=UPI00146FC5D3|nr:helix-turn-helix transcriptional regulator [Salibacterium aidingense]